MQQNRCQNSNRKNYSFQGIQQTKKWIEAKAKYHLLHFRIFPYCALL